MQIRVLKANPIHIESIAQIIQYYAEQGIMLPRSEKVIEQQLEDFVVAKVDGMVVGCGSLTRLGTDLVEIRSLGVKPEYKGKGIGRQLVESLVIEADKRKIPKVMALTYESNFFERLGFSIVSKDIFPEKVWKDCIYCSKQNSCDEIAVLKQIV